MASQDSQIGPRERRTPPGEDRPRLVCPDCGHIQYENPKIVVGSVVTAPDGRVLLARRAIPPRTGYWTMPAGYLELHEDAAHGARREAWEEAGAAIELDQLLAVYSIPRIHQVQLIYRAHLPAPGEIVAGPESAELGLFAPEAIPWAELAFPSVRWALTHARAVAHLDVFAPFGNPEGETGDLAPGERS